MKADEKFLKQAKSFWAYVRTISQEVGYTERKTGKIKVPTIAEVCKGFDDLDLSTDALLDKNNIQTEKWNVLSQYFTYRATVLNEIVKQSLMDKDKAERVFEELHSALKPSCPLPMNKQKGDKKNYAFLTCIVNMLVENSIAGGECNYDPRELTTITEGNKPLRTLARRVDGAYPSPINPIAIWEIKEYYYTTTFGSRVADGVYETLLDGLELEELHENTGRKIEHVLIVDDYFTWWDCGKSYLCRMIDMLHMGYVDEVIFGKEVLERMPQLVEKWKKANDSRVR